MHSFEYVCAFVGKTKELTDIGQNKRAPDVACECFEHASTKTGQHIGETMMSKFGFNGSRAFARNASRFALGVSLLAIAVPSFAQDEVPADEDAANAEEPIVVTGIRGAINNSVQAKKNNTSIVEVISAEDIGKLPDQSIAESLSRLPGLATQRLDGRANVVSIRGLAPDFTTTLLNGREQVSANNNRGVELDQYPSELLNGAIVYKTPDASLIGQALGGTIDMKSVRPLAYGKRAIVLGGRFEINDLGKLNPDISNKGYRVNFSYIDQNEAGTLGWAIGYARMSSPTAEERWQAWGYPNDHAPAAGNLVIGGAKPYVKSNKLNRDGLMGVLEYQPDDKLHVTLDGYWSQFKDDQRLRGMELPLAWGGQGETLQPGFTAEDGLVTSGAFNNVKAVVRNDIVKRDSEIFAGGLNVEYKTSDSVTLMADLSYSHLNKSERNIEIYAGTGRGGANGARDTLGFEVDPSGVIRFSPTLDYTNGSQFVLTDPRGWCGRPGFPGDCQDGFINAPEIEDQLASLRLQAKIDVGGFVDNFVIGGNYGVRTKSLLDEGYVLTHKNYPANTVIPSDYLYDPVSLDFIGIPGIIAFDSLRYYEDGNYVKSAESAWTSGRKTNSWTIKERVLTGYLQANFNSQAGSTPIRGNAGLQLVYTDQTGDGFGAANFGSGVVVTPINDGEKYLDILPSMNLSFEVWPDKFLRLGVARVLARPRMDQINPGSGYNFDISKNVPGATVTNSPWSGTNGNARLRPLIADSIDLAFESYFGRGGYIALSGFYKYLENYIYRRNTEADFSGFATPGNVPAVINTGIVSQWQNGGSGRLYGAELSASLPLGNLSESLDGFGLLASGSYTQSRVQEPGAAPTAMPGLSKWVVNGTAYFEKSGFQVRVSGRYRSSFLAEVAGLSLVRDLYFARSEFLVDAQIGYTFQSGPLEGLGVLVTGSNLTNEPFITYQNGDIRQVRDNQNYGRNFMAGVSYKF